MSWLILLLDALILPGGCFCKWLTERMLAGGKPCTWAAVGIQCGTCGGTHCVQSFFSGDILSAFTWNPMVFFGILYVIATLVLLNLAFVFRRERPKTWLRNMYSVTALVTGVGVMMIFTYMRNAPLIARLAWGLVERIF